MPIHHLGGISQIGKMVPHPGSSTLCRDQPPRVSWGFALPLCLVYSQTHTSVLYPQVLGKAGKTNARFLSACLVPSLGVIKASCSIYKNHPREQRDKGKEMPSFSHSSAPRQRAWPGVIVRQDVEPHQGFRLKRRLRDSSVMASLA